MLLLMLSASAAFSAGRVRADEVRSDEARATVEIAFGSVSVKYEDVILPEYDHTMTAELTERRINAPLDEKLSCVEDNLALGSTPKAAMLYCFPLLERKVDEFLAAAECDPRDASMDFRPYGSPMFTIKREASGWRVDEQRLYYDVYLALRKGARVKVTAAATELKPSVTAEELARCTVRRSAFSTDYSRSGENRKHNIRLALSRLNGVRIDAGEEFCFNRTVGRRTKANGYQTAKIIVGGEYVDGTGGGVCQASTTLYNAALLAGMRVTEARSHSLPPSYVPPSFDAMVNSGTSDLRFVNDGDGPVFIRAYGTDERAVVEFYGSELPYRIVRESKVISRSAVPDDRVVVDTDFRYVTPDTAPGERVRVSYGAAGVSSEGYLCYYDRSGKLTDRKLIRKDVYGSSAGLVAVRPLDQTAT